MGRSGTAPRRTRVGTNGSVGSAVGPGWLSGPRFDRHFIGSTAAIAILSGLLAAANPARFLPILPGTLLRQEGDTDGRVDRLLAQPGLRPVAILSYSLYLVHMTAIPAAKLATNALMGDITVNIAAHFAIFVPIYLGLSVLGALILYFAVEKPFLMLRDARF